MKGIVVEVDGFRYGQRVLLLRDGEPQAGTLYIWRRLVETEIITSPEGGSPVREVVQSLVLTEGYFFPDELGPDSRPVAVNSSRSVNYSLLDHFAHIPEEEA